MHSYYQVQLYWYINVPSILYQNVFDQLAWRWSMYQTFEIPLFQHINDTVTQQFEDSSEVSDLFEVMIKNVLPCLQTVVQAGSQEDITAVEEIREKWCSFLGQEIEGNRPVRNSWHLTETVLVPRLLLLSGYFVRVFICQSVLLEIVLSAVQCHALWVCQVTAQASHNILWQRLTICRYKYFCSR